MNDLNQFLQDNSVAVIGISSAVVSSILGGIIHQIKNYHKVANSNFQELLALTRETSFALGEQRGRSDLLEEQDKKERESGGEGMSPSPTVPAKTEKQYRRAAVYR